MPIVPAIVGSLVLEPGPALPGQTCPNQYLLLVLCCLLHGSPPHSSCSTPPTKAELAGAGYGADGPEVLTGAGPTQMQLVGESSQAHRDVDQQAEATSTTCAVLLSMQGSVWLLCLYTRWCALHVQHTHRPNLPISLQFLDDMEHHVYECRLQTGALCRSWAIRPWQLSRTPLPLEAAAAASLQRARPRPSRPCLEQLVSLLAALLVGTGVPVAMLLWGKVPVAAVGRWCLWRRAEVQQERPVQRLASSQCSPVQHRWVWHRAQRDL